MTNKGTPSVTRRVKSGCGMMHVTIEPARIIAKLGKAGGCASANCGALDSQMISLYLEDGHPIDRLIGRLSGHLCQHSNEKLGIRSCPDAIAEALRRGSEE